jgi:hypothetical protein
MCSKRASAEVHLSEHLSHWQDKLSSAEIAGRGVSVVVLVAASCCCCCGSVGADIATEGCQGEGVGVGVGVGVVGGGPMSERAGHRGTGGTRTLATLAMPSWVVGRGSWVVDEEEKSCESSWIPSGMRKGTD